MDIKKPDKFKFLCYIIIMAGLAFDCLMNEKYLTMKIKEFREFVKEYGFCGIKKENWHYQAIKLPEGYRIS